MRMLSGEKIDFSKVDTTGLDPTAISNMLYKQATLDERIRSNKIREGFALTTQIDRSEAKRIKAEEKALLKSEADTKKLLAKERDDRALLIAGNVQPKDIAAQISQSSMNGQTEDLKDLFEARKLQSLTGTPKVEADNVTNIMKGVGEEAALLVPDENKFTAAATKLKAMIPKEQQKNLTSDRATALDNLKKVARKTLKVRTNSKAAYS